MTVITARIIVAPDGGVLLTTPLPAGEYHATLTTTESAPRGKPFRMEGFPVDDLGWDDSISLHREDMSGDDGR